MNKVDPIQLLLGQTDIYLVDQILKGRYTSADTVLDAGCGNGRNMHWFLQNNFNMYASDISEKVIADLKNKYTDLSADHLFVCSVNETPFPDDHFNHIICSAVLHFAESTEQFSNMLKEITRILKPGGSVFIRMASDIGYNSELKPISDGVYQIPDGTKRFLLTRSLLKDAMQLNNLSFLEPLKTTNVADFRCMSTLVLQKN